jgi:hypothetical protein
MNPEPEVWKRAYEDCGFVVVPGLLDAETL